MSDQGAPICRQCGYDFTGLAERGICPECGSSYNLSTGSGIRKNEIDAAHRATFLVRRARTILLVVAAVCVMICAGVASTLARVPAKPLWVGAFIAGICLLGAVTSYVYEREEE